MLLVSIVYIIS